ncbi:beta-CASP ribonuclease aCPSF1 [Candidatus Woesearchaeota archaeon]|nr:beta-CASP ribonuclease aCPSF1 [Candidatus Woesearchaeota archaeon]
MPSKILDEILGRLPKEAGIVETAFEGANIILYTKNKDFFLNDNTSIKNIVNTIKKRIELRPDPSICVDSETSKKIIEELIPKEAGISNIFFDSFRSVVTIEAEKPGVAIGRAGEILKEIRRKTFWVPMISRTPALRSKIIENIRYVLYENSEQRKKFLNQVGKKIYDGWVNERKSGWVRLTFLGAGREVGRSCIFLQTQESRVLLDCGLNTAANDESAYPILDIPEFSIKDIDAVIISHAHLDHVAFLPYLVKYGYSGPIYCTAPTRDVMALLQLDYIAVGQKEARKALYSSSDIKQMVKQTICLDYEEVTDITSDIRLTLYNSGHTLGSAMAHLHIGNGLHNLLYTGDMKFETSNLLPCAVTKFPRLETVILESTYGGKDNVQPSRQEAEQYLLDVVRSTVNRRGKILMPILGVGRSQEMMLIIERAIREGTIEKIPIYVQGMVWDVTAIHTAYPEFFDRKIRKSVFHKDYNPFLSDIFKRVGSRKEMQDVMDYEGPCIIIATSGMMTGGPSVEYFKQMADNSKNSLVFTCYQGEGSLGRRIQNGEKEIVFQNGSKHEVIEVKMDIFKIEGFSGHCDRNQLINFVYRLSPKPKRIIVNHGEASRCLDLSSTLHKLNNIETMAPRNLETIRVR